MIYLPHCWYPWREIKPSLRGNMGGIRPRLCQLSAMTFPTANKTMALLVDSGIARELTGQRRNRVFSYDAYLSILNEGGEPL